MVDALLFREEKKKVFSSIKMSNFILLTGFNEFFYLDKQCDCAPVLRQGRDQPRSCLSRCRPVAAAHSRKHARPASHGTSLSGKNLDSSRIFFFFDRERAYRASKLTAISNRSIILIPM